MMRLSALCLLLFIAATHAQAAVGIAESLPKRTEEMLVAAECSYKLTGEENEETSENDESRIVKCFEQNLDEGKEAKHIKYISGYISPSRLGVDAFYLAKTKCGDYILSFRGTLPLPHSESHDPLKDYILNLSFWQSVADWINDAKIKGSKSGMHYGFHESWLALKRNLFQVVKSKNSTTISFAKQVPIINESQTYTSPDTVREGHWQRSPHSISLTMRQIRFALSPREFLSSLSKPR